jgi:hypothetical protein
MIRLIIIMLLVAPLLSVSPAPVQLSPAVVARVAVSSVVVPRAAQPCDAETARLFGSYLRRVVRDNQGIPFGEVAAWTCGDVGEAIAELQQRQAEMQVAANAFRDAHPLR